MAERWLDDLADLIAARPEVPVYLVSEDLAEQVTGFHVHRGALASLHRRTASLRFLGSWPVAEGSGTGAPPPDPAEARDWLDAIRRGDDRRDDGGDDAR